MCHDAQQETLEEFVNALQVFVLELEGRQRTDVGDRESERRLLEAARVMTALLQRGRVQ